MTSVQSKKYDGNNHHGCAPRLNERKQMTIPEQKQKKKKKEKAILDLELRI